MAKYFSLFIIIIYLLIGCSSNNNLSRIDTYMEDFSEIKAQKLLIPPTLISLHNSNRKTSASYQVVNFINTECGVCYTKMEEWQNFIQASDLHAQVLFITAGKLTSYFQDYLRENDRLPFTIYLDSSRQTLIQSKLIAYEKETFLIDKQGKILLVGDPVKDKMIHEYYESITSE